MRKMRDAGIAEFCWDFSSAMLCDPMNRSSMFMSQNVMEFPQAFTLDDGPSDKAALAEGPAIHVLSVPSAVGQAKYLPEILQEIAAEKTGGDLKIQREIVMEYILAHEDWQLDVKEYFEGAQSGYRNHVKDRAILYEVLEDAKMQEFDILVVYKDDRIGRLMWEIGAYIMQLKSYGVDIYTTKDGCISPDRSDIMGQMMLALRYGNAQKSSADTGQRVKDTAQKLVKNGRLYIRCTVCHKCRSNKVDGQTD